MSEQNQNNQNNQNNMDNTAALYQLLERLEKRDEVRRHRAFNQPLSSDLVTIREEDVQYPEEDIRLQPARFQPDNVSDTDLGGLLLTEAVTEEPEEEEISAPLPVFVQDLPEEDEALPPPANKRNPFVALWGGFVAQFPRREDPTGTKVRKYGFFTSLLVMLIAAAYLLADLVILPAKHDKLKEELIELYHPEKSLVQITKEQAEKGDYPVNMLASFIDLYDRNDEVRGWITYHASGSEDFLDIEYPIVYSGDNEKYLNKDFDGSTTKYGTLFFDKDNRVNHYTDTNRSLIIYGHDMANGDMFGGLHKLMGNLQNARAAATLSMSTLFESAQYQVFAVILTDEDDTKKGHYFNTRRTSFENDEDFLNYIEEMKKRSMFDYPVEVKADDQILVLSTCTRKSTAKIKNGRLVVVARRVPAGESATVDTSAIVKKSYDIDDPNSVIMPYNWYVNQKLEPHPYYSGGSTDKKPTQTTAGTTTQTLPTVSTSPTRPGTLPTDTTDGSVTGSTDSTGTTQSSGTSGSSSSSSSNTQRPTDSSTSTSSTTQPSQSTHTTTHVHQYEKRVTAEATCTKAGEMTFTCTGCKDTYTEVIPATGHTYNEQGKCTACGAACPHSTNECGAKCQICGAHVPHAWGIGVINKQPTCSEQGEIVYTCTKCGEEHYDQSQHNAGDSQPVHVRKEACVEPGECWYKCQDCGELFLKDVFPVGHHVYDDDQDHQCNGCGHIREDEED